MPFQNKVNLCNPAGWPGGFASVNPRVSVFVGGPSNDSVFGAGEGGVQAGTFVWFNETDNTLDNKGTGAPDGFVANEWQGLITQYLEEYSMMIPQGFMITAYSEGEFFVQLAEDATAVVRKDPVFVDPTTGKVVDSAATGAVQTNYKYARSANAGELTVISSWVQGKDKK